jgi:hypothetical protein
MYVYILILIYSGIYLQINSIYKTPLSNFSIFLQPTHSVRLKSEFNALTADGTQNPSGRPVNNTKTNKPHCHKKVIKKKNIQEASDLFYIRT